MIYDEESGNYVNLLNKVTYPKKKIVEHLKSNKQIIFSSQGRCLDPIELSEDYECIIKPDFIKDSYYSHKFRYYVDDYPLETVLALEFLVVENYGNCDYNGGLLWYIDLAKEYFRQEQETENDVLDIIKQIYTLGYFSYEDDFYRDFKYIHTGEIPWDDYVITNNIELKMELIYHVFFERGFHPMDDKKPKKSLIRLYSRYVNKITLYELVYIRLYGSRFNDITKLDFT